MSGTPGARDPFTVMGLGEDASPDEIEAAYRRLAKKWHPNAFSGSADPERFRELKDARDSLLDPAKRSALVNARRAARAVSTDDAFSGFFDQIKTARGSEIRPGRRVRGVDLERELTVSLEEAYSGGIFTVGAAPAPCRVCAGKGRVASAALRTCPDCAGAGRSRRVRGIVSVEVECPTCAGEGSVRSDACSACGGTGRSTASDVAVEIPPGSREGMRIRLEGRGAPGLGGASAGDLEVILRIAPHPRFQRQGQDLKCGLELPLWEAALGTTRRITGIDGAAIDVRIPAGTQPGAKFVFDEAGMPAFSGRGKLEVTVAVSVPDASSGPLRAVFEALREVQGDA